MVVGKNTPPLPNAPAEHGRGVADLVARLRASSWTIEELALLAGVTRGTLERYMQPASAAKGHVMPYPLQYTLNALAENARAAPRAVRSNRKSKRPE